ncbi:hypothetical protein ACWKW1_11485 [Brevibacillus parabrevis]
MNLTSPLNTHGPCVGQLLDELLLLERATKTWEFPYDIHYVWRVLPESYGRKTFRRFDSKDRLLDLDISIIYEQYQRIRAVRQIDGLL